MSIESYNYPQKQPAPMWQRIMTLVIVALMFALLALYFIGCKPCKELTVTKIDTIRQTIVKVDTVNVENKELYDEIQRVYSEKDSIEMALQGCISKPAGIIINNNGKWKQKDNKIQFEQYYLDRINSLTMTNSRLIQENRDLKNKVIIKDNVEKDKSKTKTDNSIQEKTVMGSTGATGFFCRNIIWFAILIFCLGMGTGGFLVNKFRHFLS